MANVNQSTLLRVRFSSHAMYRLRSQAHYLAVPLAALIRAFCRVPLTNEQLHAAAAKDVRGTALFRVRFSAPAMKHLRAQAKELVLPRAALIRAFCRQPLTDEQLLALVAHDDVKRGLPRGHRFVAPLPPVASRQEAMAPPD